MRETARAAARARTRSSRTSASATRAGTRRRRRRGGVRQFLARTTCAPVMDGDWAARARARPGRGDAAGRRARDRPLRRGARDLHRARVPDARTGAGGRGTWPSTCSRPRGRRCTRRSTASSRCARTATGRGDYGGLLVLRHGGLLDAARASRSGDARDRRGAGGRGDRAAGRAGGQRRLGAAPAPAALHRSGERPARAWRLSDEADVWRSVCPDPNLLLGLARRRRRAAAAAGHRRAPAGGDEPGALARLPRAAAHRARARRVSLRRRRPRVPRPRQQRRARRALPSARGRGGRARRWRS